MSPVSAERIAEVFVEAADTLVEDFDLVDFLYRLTERAAELASATAAGLLLADVNGRLAFMAGSDERTQLLEFFQVQSGEGPCRDAFQSGTPVHVPDLASVTSARWSRFVPRALAAGFRAVHAFPLQLRGDVIGAIGVFADTPQDLSPALVRIMQALADVATVAVLQERAVRQGEILTEQLQGALNSRIVIEQAKGALAQIHGIDVDEAFAMMREYVTRNNLRLVDTAAMVLTQPDDISGLTHPQA